MDINKAVKALGLPLLQQYYNEFCKRALEQNCSIVSVGSGLGTVESALQHGASESGTPNTIICIDPEPTSFQIRDKSNTRTEKAPDYATVDDMLQKFSDEEKKFALFINWALPNDSTYDFDAISKLDPMFILVVCDTSGGSGGTMFYRWLTQRTNLQATTKEFVWTGDLKPAVDAEMDHFDVLATTMMQVPGYMGDSFFRYILLQKKDLSTKDNLLDAKNLQLPLEIESELSLETEKNAEMERTANLYASLNACIIV